MTRILIGTATLILAGVMVLIGVEIYHEVTEPDSGLITDLEYQEGYYTTTCITSGRSTTCYPQWHPECYWVEYRDERGRTGDDCVNAEEFAELAVGDRFPGGAS